MVSDDDDDDSDQEAVLKDLREFEFRTTVDGFFLRALEGDVARAEEIIAGKSDDDFARRTLVRTIFAEVEGLCASAIDWARYYAQDESTFRHRYTSPERAILNNQVAKLNGDGFAEWRPNDRYLSAKQTIRFALILAGRLANAPPTTDYLDGGWAALCEGMKVRDRLMHPKGAEDLVVSDDELAQVRRGRAWFVGAYKAQQAAIQKERAGEFSRKFRDWMAQEAAKETDK